MVSNCLCLIINVTTMTPEEDQANARFNEQIRQCQHRVYWSAENGVQCTVCGAKFLLLLLPRLNKVYPIQPDDDE